MDFPDFCEKYKADAIFQNDVDTTAPTILSGGAPPINSARECVSIETQQLVVIVGPSYSVLRESDLKHLGGDASKASRAAPLYLPCLLDGTEGAKLVYLMSDGKVDYPKAKLVTMLGPRHSQFAMEAHEHLLKSQGALAFLHAQD